VWGRLEPAGSHDALPIGLADGARVVRPVPAGAVVSRADVAVADPGLAALRERAERAMSPAPSGRLRP
jgi:predicted homoserine dehydrogenase-like protein